MSELKGKRIFLTGGTGFFGKWLLRALPASARITVLSRDPKHFVHAHPEFGGVEFLRGDVRNFPLPVEHFDYVIHGAASSATPLADDEMESVIIRGTEHVLQMNFDKMLYISSGAVYGPNPPESVAENISGTPVNAYGRGKKAAEQFCLASGKAVTVARCFAFVGPYLPLDAHFAIGNFINDCLHRRPLVIKGDGTPLRSYLYAGDLAAWLLKILTDGAPGRAYNVGSDQSLSIRELAGLVKTVCGNPRPVEIRTPPVPGQPVSAYVPDISRARHELGLKITVPLKDAIRRTFDHYRET